MRKVFGYLLVCMGLGILVYVWYKNSTYSTSHPTFSSHTILTSSWEKYKASFMKDGRVIDYNQNSITTSEGQSYALLRSVWIDDKTTFDTTWQWTKTNLKRKNDNLFGWKWGQRANKSYGFLEQGGDNSATDADEDIALALIFAGHRWGDSTYIDTAKPILNDIWTIETAQTQRGHRYLVAGNWAQNNTDLIINPSYFAPYAWRVFAQVDKTHDWNSLIDPAYDVLTKATTSPLDTGNSADLPPDWFILTKNDETIKVTGYPNLKTTYAFDAMRIPWRIALDYQWNKSPQAYDYLRNHLGTLASEYTTKNMLSGTYTHDGKGTSAQNASMYATSLGYFMIANPDIAKKVYEDKIIKLYSNDDNTFHGDIPYYEQNWLWFGAALYNHFLVQL